MAVTDLLGAPTQANIQEGRYTLNRYVLCEASAAAPVVWNNLNGIVGISVTKPTFEKDAFYRQQGGADKLHIQRDPTWDVTVTVESGAALALIAAFQGLTWGSTGGIVAPLRVDTDNPMIIWEAIARGADNTHLWSLILQDLILDDVGIDNPMDYADRTLTFHTYHEPFTIAPGYEMVLDKWAATPATATYSLSATPATMLASYVGHDDWVNTKCVYVKNLDYSVNTTTSIRVNSGWSLTGTALVFASGTPAASDVVSILYGKLTT